MKAASMPGYAFARLAWRPAALIAAPILIGFLMFPIYGLPDNPGDLFGPVSARISAEKVRFALWQMAIALPGISGFILGLATHEVRQAGISWMIPRYRARLLPPAILLGAPFVLLTAIVAARASSRTVALGALGLGVFAFSFAWRTTDRTIPARWTTIAVVALFALMLKPEFVDNLFGSHPILVAAFSAAVGIAWWLPEISAQTNRELVVKAPGIPGELIIGRGARSFPTSLSVRTTIGRVYAGVYESPGGVVGHFRALTYQTLFIGVYSVALRVTGMVATFPMLFSILMGTQLKDVFPYPMSRRDRANAFFAASLFDTTVAATIAGGSVLLLTAVGLWRDDSRVSTPGHALLRLLFLFLLAPIAQSVQASRNLKPTRKNKVPATRMLVSLALTIVWFGLAQGADRMFADSIQSTPPLIVAIAAIGGFLIIQTINLVGLRWYFARRDFPN